MPSDGHWGTVDAGVVWVEDGGVHQEDKPYLVGIGVVGKGMGVGVGEGQYSIEDNEILKNVPFMLKTQLIYEEIEKLFFAP
jgi:hypothetical protein